ncbi:MAG: transposase [Thermoguttaceae bacterium]|nr:transposase [Thermoguttaceae bacterium]
MNEYKDPLTQIIIAISNSLYKPSRHYFEPLLFGSIINPGTISKWLKEVQESKAKQYYNQIGRIGIRDDKMQIDYSLWLIKALELDKRGRFELMVDDTPIKRYGKHVQGAGFHHDPTDKVNSNSYYYGHSMVAVSVVYNHPKWGTITLPLRWRFYVREENLKTITKEVRPLFQTKLEIASDLLNSFKATLEKAEIRAQITVLFDRGYVFAELLEDLLIKEGKPSLGVEYRFVTRFKKNALLFELPPKTEGTRGRGRPCKYGLKRKIDDIVADPSIPLCKDEVALLLKL